MYDNTAILSRQRRCAGEVQGVSIAKKICKLYLFPKETCRPADFNDRDIAPAKVLLMRL